MRPPRAHQIHGRGRAARWMLLAGTGATAALGLALLLPPMEWPRQVAVLVNNESSTTVLVDARWWGGTIGIAGPLAVRLEPGSSAIVLAPAGHREACVRVIDPRTARVSGVLVALGPSQDTVSVTVRKRPHEAPMATLTTVCAPTLQGDRVRVALGRYFDPDDPGRLRRERLIRRYRSARSSPKGQRFREPHAAAEQPDERNSD